jgi:hypothetical protein
MTAEQDREVINLPLDRPIEVGRFVFASAGGAYRFTLTPENGGYDICAEWCEFGEQEPCDGGYDFWGGSRWFPTAHGALGCMYEWVARAALDEKHQLEEGLEKSENE